MQKFMTGGALLLVAVALSACGGGSSTATPPTMSVPQTREAQSSQAITPEAANHWTPVFVTLPSSGVNERTLEQQAQANVTVPFFTSSVVSPLDHHTYSFRIVGANPITSSTTTNVSFVPIVLRIHFSDGTVLDPTKPACGDSVSVETRFFHGPNFVAVPLTSNGISVGTTQLTDAFQRAEFWSIVHAKAYHTMLVAGAAPLVLTVNAPAGSPTFGGVCAGIAHRIGTIDINSYDAIVRSIAAAHAQTSQVPVVLTYNVFQTQGGQCCVLGYHSAFGRTAGTQVYSVGAYNDPGIFSAPIEDVHAWTHELGELLNDPFVNNATPAWGHIGQVAGCQSNLEVGDPLTGTAFLVALGGHTYHPQELAFFDWFYRTPSKGTGGRFSFRGKFTTTQALCH